MPRHKDKFTISDCSFDMRKGGHPEDRTPPRAPGLKVGLTSPPTRLPLSPRTPTLPENSCHNHQPDITGVMEALSGAPASTGESRGQGIKYMTEDLIRRRTKQDNLALVHTLNLSSSKAGDKTFKFIENLDKCERLQLLFLNHNSIEKMEKLEKLVKLRELHLADNRIRKIEGLEHMASLQHLNLSSNSIEHVPLWLAKKLCSLQVLNLQQNKISSLYEVTRLKTLRNLSQLSLSDNPVSSLPHYRPFFIYHLRSLHMLDGQPISQQERDHAHQRFHMEELVGLEQQLEARAADIENLQKEQGAAAARLHQQEALNLSLQQSSREQQHCLSQMEEELHTKTDLLKKQSVELTRACQKHYELEQELAFHKIDAKFVPLPFYPGEVEVDSPQGESPYIGKARHQRRTVSSDELPTLGTTAGETQTDHPSGDTVPVQAQDCSMAQATAEARLQQLTQQLERAEQQVLRATTELQQLEESVAQKRVCEAEKDVLRQRLHRKLQAVRELRGEEEVLERQLEEGAGQRRRAQEELDHLMDTLRRLDPSDPRHTHVTAQAASKKQLLDMMNRKHRELEGRLDDMLSRIAKETEEIKDLEQQLTDGQILANEALQRDLEGIIAGLQEYLGGVKDQARRAQDDCQQLQGEKEALRSQLAESQENCSRLEAAVRTAKTAQEEWRAQRAELEAVRAELEAVRTENAALRDAQSQISAYEAELEDQLQQHHTQAGQLREELGRLRRLSQLEHATLQAELEKERQAKENALAQVQLATQREQEADDLLEQLSTLQEERASLQQHVQSLQGLLEETRSSMLSPKEVKTRLEELRANITSAQPSYRSGGEGDPLGCSLEALQQDILRLVSAAQAEREEALQEQRRLGGELASTADRLQEQQQAALQARLSGDQRREEELEGLRAELGRMGEELEGRKAELGGLGEELEEAHRLQGETARQLDQIQEERDRLLAELEDQHIQARAEKQESQQQLRRMDRQLQQLRKNMSSTDKMAAQHLNATAEQLSSLHGTVHLIDLERTEEAEDREEFRSQAARASEELIRAQAEIQLLHKLLQDRMCELDSQSASLGQSACGELDRLRRALDKQEKRTQTLQQQLAETRDENNDSLAGLLEEVGALRASLALTWSSLAQLLTDLNHRTRGQRHYVPAAANAPSLGSQGTQDSGLGSHHPSSPDRGCQHHPSSPDRGCQHHPISPDRGCHHLHHSSRGRGAASRDRRPPAGSGYWVYTPPAQHASHVHTHRGEPRDSGGGSDADGSSCASGRGSSPLTPPPGSIVYTALPKGCSQLPPGWVAYTPPAPGPDPHSGLSSSPGTVIYGPPPEGAALLYGPAPSFLSGPWPTLGVLHCNIPQHRRMEQGGDGGLGEERGRRSPLERDVVRLEEQRSQLRLELKQLRRSLSRLQRHREVLEAPEPSATQQQEEVGELLEEVRCVEQTLLKRRAELREADRRLLEAHSCLKDTRDKTKESVQRCSEAQQRVFDTQKELEEMEQRAQHSATLLLEAKQQLGLLQEEVGKLRRCREEEEQSLLEVKEVLRTRDLQYQEVSQQMRRDTDRLECVNAQVRELQEKEAACQEAENILDQRRRELDRLNTQVRRQQEELCVLDRRLGARREEERAGQERVEQHRQTLEEVLRQGQEEVQQLQRSIKELSGDAEALCVQKGELEAQVSERKARVASLRQEGEEEEEVLRSLCSQVNKHRAEMKRLLETLQLENQELQGVKLQLRQRVDLLERSQHSLLEVRAELQALQQTVLQQRSEVELHRKEAELERAGLEELRKEAESVRQQREESAQEGSRLQEQCRNLEDRRKHAERCLTAAEEGARAAEAVLARLEAELAKLEAEQRHAHSVRQEVDRDTAATQQRLQEGSGELSLLREQVEGRRRQLDVLEQELQASTRGRDTLQREEHAVREELEERREHLQQQSRREEELQTRLGQLEREEAQRRAQLETQSQEAESALAQRRLRLQELTAAVAELEGRSHRLHREQEDSALLQERLLELGQEVAEREAGLQRRGAELRALRAELERCRAEDGERLERAEQERAGLQRALSAAEQAAEENRQRNKGLLQEVHTANAQLLCLREKLRSQEEGESRLREIKAAMRSLRWDVKAELINGIPQMDTALDDGVSDTETQKENDPRYSPSADSRPACNTTDEQWRGEVLRERLRQQEDHLKAQLRRRMWCQEESLCQRRQQTEGSLQGLRRRVDKLDQLLSLSASSSDSSSLSLSLPPTKRTCERPPTVPVRLDPAVPEKELAL